MSGSDATQAAAPQPVLIVTSLPAPFWRVLPRCPQLDCVGVVTAAEAPARWTAPPTPQTVLIASDVPPDEVLSLLGRARQQGLSAWLADGAVLDLCIGHELQQAFGGAGLSLHIGQPWRHRPMVESVYAALQSGQLGEPGILRLHHWQSAREPEGVPPGWEWQALRQTADLVTWLLGDIPETVWVTRPQSVARPAWPEAPVETVQIHCGGPGPAMALIDLAHGLPAGDDYWSLSIIGSRGGAYADDHRNRQLLFGGGTARAECTREGDWPLLQLLRSFSPPPSNSRTSRPVDVSFQAAALVEAMTRSLQTGESVRVQETGA